MSSHFRVTLSNAYQRVSDLLNAAAIAAGLQNQLPRTNWKRIKYVYPDSGAAGTIYFTRNPLIAGYDMKLSAPDETEDRISQREVYSECTTNMYVKSTTNGDFLNIELHDD
jgi:hypothetical protein